MKPVVAISLISTLFLFLLSQPSYASEQSLYDLCKAAFEKGDLDQARVQAELFLKSHPNSSRLDEVQFISASSESNFTAAEAKYLKLIEKGGLWSTKSRVELAERYFLKGDFAKSMSQSKSAISDHQNADLKSRIKAHYLLCKSLMATRNYDEAAAELAKLQSDMKSQTIEEDIALKIAECHFQLKNFVKAIIIYRDILAKYPKSRWVQMAKKREAQCQENLKDVEKGSQTSEPKNEEGKFLIQVGAFTDRDNAIQLISFLQDRGYKSTLIEPDKKDPKFFKVRVGAFKTEEEARIISQKLRRSEGLPAIIVYEDGEDEKNPE